MHFYSLSRYLTEEYGTPLCKLSLPSGCTCPNRDGTLGTRGCTFCSAGGSGEFAAPPDGTLEEQIRSAKERVRRKSHSDRYIAYIQSYTGTYGDPDRLRERYTALIRRPDIAVLSVATRPDCLGPEILSMLEDLRRIKPVWIELGLQTSNETTAEAVRRGYPNEVYARAVEQLNARDIKVVTHCILGLPGETETDMERTVQYACACGTWGLKLQLLHILEGTDLAAQYAAGQADVLSMDRYMNLLCTLLPQIPEDVVIHRLTGDGPKKILIAPAWSADKRMVLNTLNKVLRDRNIVQGSACPNAAADLTNL